LLPDVYIAADVDIDFRLWCEAVVIFLGPSSPGVAISGRSAVRLFGVSIGHPVLPGELPNVTTPPLPDEPVEATVPPGRFLSGAPRSAIKIVRARLMPTDITLVNTLPVTAPARTAFDVARQFGRDEAVAAIDAMLNKRIVTLVDARAYLLASPSIAGRPRVAGVFNRADAGAQSPPIPRRPRIPSAYRSACGAGRARPSARVRRPRLPGATRRHRIRRRLSP
jgi:hypothetical protein